MKKTVIIIIFFTLCLSAFGQVNTDSIFNEAINNAQNKKYAEAIEDAQKVVNLHPERYDVIVFIANVYAWQGNYEKAINNIEKAYLINQTNKELYDAWLNILLWAKNYQKLIEIADLAKEHNYKDTYNLVQKKTLAYKALTKYDKGIDFIKTHNNYLDSAAIKTLYNQMLTLNKDKATSLFYAIDLFENNTPGPQHLAYWDFAFKIRKNTFISRLNYANRFNTNDLQVEADYYHLFKNGHYLYSNYGFALKKELFPQHRAGLEYYFSFLKTFEASFGGRYMNFGDKNIYIITGHLSKYITNFWISARPFYVIHEQKNTLSTALNIRCFGKDPLNFWGVEFLYGNSPDERYAISQSEDIFILESYRLKVEKNTVIFQSNELKLSAAFAKEEFSAGNYRNRLTFEILLKHKF